jgi:hypothetical protein
LSAKDLLFGFDDLLAFEGFLTFSACNSNTFSEGFRFLFNRVPAASSVNK